MSEQAPAAAAAVVNAAAAAPQTAAAPGAGSDWNKQMWHWEERNANDFARTKLAELFGAARFALSASQHVFRVTDTPKVTGEAYCNLRKGKKNYGHDMQIKLKWRVETAAEATTVAEGSIEFPEVASDADANALEV
jgi:activator of HSP90 ATPase